MPAILPPRWQKHVSITGSSRDDHQRRKGACDGTERGPDLLEVTASLDNPGGIAIEGLSLRATARKSLADRQVTFQLEYHATNVIGGPVCRIEWRPLSGHNDRPVFREYA
jgi:hypothetical protein